MHPSETTEKNWGTGFLNRDIGLTSPGMQLGGR